MDGSHLALKKPVNHVNLFKKTNKPSACSSACWLHAVGGGDCLGVNGDVGGDDFPGGSVVDDVEPNGC